MKKRIRSGVIHAMATTPDGEYVMIIDEERHGGPLSFVVRMAIKYNGLDQRTLALSLRYDTLTHTSIRVEENVIA